jgi:hypothetical protein
MEQWAIIVFNVLGLAVIVCGVAICVRFDQRGKTRRRELEHAERMRAIELGQQLDDAAVSRNQALGAIGVAVPIASLSAASIGSCFVLVFKDERLRFAAFSVVWLVCGSACLTVVPIVITRLRNR